MGYYINPEDMSKEEFLKKHGKMLQTAPATCRNEDGDVAVCLVDNSRFTAAGIAYDQGELEAFKDPDNRLKIWFYVPAEKLKPFCRRL